MIILEILLFKMMDEKEHFTRLLREKGHIWWGAQTPAGRRRNEKKVELFQKLLRPSKGELLLEVGCGTGEYTGRIVSRGFRVVAFDLTEVCVMEACRSVGEAENCHFSVADSSRIPFRENVFDICLGVSILHHVNVKRTWAEIVRVCKNGARFFFSEPNLLNPQILLEKKIPWLKKKLEDSPRETAFIRWGLQKTLRDFAGTEVRVENIDFIHPLTPVGGLKTVERISDILERIPVLKEISGSLAIYGTIHK